MTDVQWERYPLVTQMQHAQAWLQIQANLGLAPNTVAVYGRALNDYLIFCQDQRISVETAPKSTLLSMYMTSRPGPILAAPPFVSSTLEQALPMRRSNNV